MKNVFLAFVAIALATPAAAQTAGPFKTEKREVALETVVRGLDQAWALAFLPDGRMMVTEKSGRIRIVGQNGAVSEPLAGAPTVAARGQGGLLDLVLDPDFARSRLVFATFAEPRSDGAGTAVIRMRLNDAGTGFEQQNVIFRQQPSYTGGNHFGSRIVFDRGGALFVALGDRFDLRDQAQNRANTLGKIVRINRDGSIPADNPGNSREGWLAPIWSIGHRNIQAAALHPQTGKLWTAEHGARGGDEINVPEAGKNYGWPVITYGRDYSGAKIGEGTAKAGMEQPVFYWDPSIAPSGMAFVTSDRYPEWKGNVFVGALAGRQVVRLTLNGERVVAEERLFRDVGKRIRDVRQGPDGFLYLLTDGPEGEILRMK